jgi:hypothetical protein
MNQSDLRHTGDAWPGVRRQIFKAKPTLTPTAAGAALDQIRHDSAKDDIDCWTGAQKRSAYRAAMSG